MAAAAAAGWWPPPFSRAAAARLASLLDDWVLLRTPYHGIFVHLALVGVPYRFGLLPTGWLRGWVVPESMVDDRCTVFYTHEQLRQRPNPCTPLEEFAIRDYGVRFLLQYELAFVVLLTVALVRGGNRVPATRRRRRTRQPWVRNSHRSDADGKNTSTGTTQKEEEEEGEEEGDGSVAVTAAAVAFHKVLLLTSSATVLSTMFVQNYYRPPPYRFEFLNTDFFVRSVLYHLLAVAASWRCVAVASKRRPAPRAFAAEAAAPPTTAARAMKWSIPGNAVFCGAVVNVFVSVFSFQVLFYERGGMEKYYNATTAATPLVPPSDESSDGSAAPEEGGGAAVAATIAPLVRVCLALSAFHTLFHAVLLLRIRTFLSVPQLRAVCLYKFLVNVALPLYWFPDAGPHVAVDERLTFGIRAALLSTYFFGFLWAGQADGVGRILSGEKDD